MKQMPLQIAGKINMAFSEGRELSKKIEDMIFTFTCSRRNWHCPHIISSLNMQSFNVISGIPRNAQNSFLVSMSMISNFDI